MVMGRRVGAALIAGGFKMSGWARLPRHRGLLGLFHEATKTHLRGSQQLGFAAM